MLSNEVTVGNGGSLWKASRSTAEQSSSRSLTGRLGVVEPHPVCLAEVHQSSPRTSTRRDLLTEVVKHPDILIWDRSLTSSARKGLQNLRLREEKLALRSLDMMCELVGGVGWI